MAKEKNEEKKGPVWLDELPEDPPQEVKAPVITFNRPRRLTMITTTSLKPKKRRKSRMITTRDLPFDLKTVQPIEEENEKN